MKSVPRYLVLLAGLVLGFGCSVRPSGQQSAESFAPPDHLTAALINGDVLLHWKNNSAADGGNWVEFATPGSDYTKLRAFTSDTNVTSFIHPRVAPQTTFLYHIQPFFGQATAPVGITTDIATQATTLEEGPIAPTHVARSGEKLRQFSIRRPATFAQAAPADLTATLSSPNSVDLHWTDCSLDEDGYLVEIGPSAHGTFQVCALLAPNATSFRKTELPSRTKCFFRVRAYFYGKPSAAVSVDTVGL
jgi:hypothetical protein